MLDNKYEVIEDTIAKIFEANPKGLELVTREACRKYLFNLYEDEEFDETVEEIKKMALGFTDGFEAAIKEFTIIAFSEN